MFIHLSIHYPKAGRERELIASMRRFGAAATGIEGLREVHTLKDARSGTLLGLAIWEDEASWRAGVEVMRAAVADDPFEAWEEREADVFTLTEV
jgi:heme-degrading monooxygenase HmoA